LKRIKFNLYIIIFEIIIISIVIGLLYKMNIYHKALYNSTEQRLSMLSSSDKLRQSSDDLTHFARTYVITNNQKYKKQYFDTLDIRNGKKPRPLHYESIYWDLTESSRKINHPNSEKISLREIMIKLPFSKKELNKLELSVINSNDLVNLEVEAFNAMNGLYKDKNNQYTIKKDINQSLAIRLLHSEDYYLAKHKIMKPIDDFMLMLDQRTKEEVKILNTKIQTNFIIFVFCFIVFIIGNIIIYKYLNRNDAINNKYKDKLLLNSTILNKNLESTKLELQNKNMKLIEQSKLLTITYRELEKSEYELEEINKNLEKKVIQEIRKNKSTQEQLFKSEKMAAMGEMIGNIAHQWRQPLSVISTASTGMLMQKEYGILEDEIFEKSCTAINSNAQYLSKTIDDFRNFIKGDRNKKIFNLKEDINSFMVLVEGTIKTHNLNMILDIDENIQINGYENELVQCFINIFNNAKDILIENNIENKLIFISTSKDNDKVKIKIKDNAGGISEDVLPKIFEPYFTTKHQNQGTGLGLHMTYKLVVEGMNGTVEAHNVNYLYDDTDYVGAEFVITLPFFMS